MDVRTRVWAGVGLVLELGEHVDDRDGLNTLLDCGCQHDACDRGWVGDTATTYPLDTKNSHVW